MGQYPRRSADIHPNYKEAEGVSLRQENINHNPGLRNVAKLALYSFWGKFGKKPNRSKSQYITEPSKFKQLANDTSVEIMMIYMVNENCLLVETKSRENFEPDNIKTNDIVASFTTCWARLKLYSLIDQLGRRILYMDTDSIIFTAREGQDMPLLGDLLN